MQSSVAVQRREWKRKGRKSYSVSASVVASSHMVVVVGRGVEKKESQKIRKTDLGPGLHQEREERVGQGGKVALFSLKLRNTGRPSQTL